MCPQEAEIEASIGRGQVEELLEQAKEELRLIVQYAQWRMWEQKPSPPEPANSDNLYAQFAAAGDGERVGAQGPLREVARAKQRELQAREAAAAKAKADAEAAAAKAKADAAAAAAKAAAPAAPAGAAPPNKA
jgi:hypothetical protein